jgi:hypothetical protein
MLMLRWRLCKKTSAAFSSHSSSKEDKAIEQKLLYTKKQMEYHKFVIMSEFNDWDEKI